MTTQLFWIILGIFILGLFIGSNLGVMLMCVLRAASPDRVQNEEPVLVTVRVRN